jgi:hypothetical protein
LTVGQTFDRPPLLHAGGAGGGQRWGRTVKAVAAPAEHSVVAVGGRASSGGTQGRRRRLQRSPSCGARSLSGQAFTRSSSSFPPHAAPLPRAWWHPGAGGAHLRWMPRDTFCCHSPQPGWASRGAAAAVLLLPPRSCCCGPTCRQPARDSPRCSRVVTVSAGLSTAHWMHVGAAAHVCTAANVLPVPQTVPWPKAPARRSKGTAGWWWWEHR